MLKQKRTPEEIRQSSAQVFSSKNVALKRLGLGALCLWSLAVAVGACSAKEEEVLPPEASGVVVEISHSTATLTPMEVGPYSERSTLVMLRVSGPEAQKAELEVAPLEGLTFEIGSSFSGGAKTFVVIVHYDGITAVPGGLATLELKLANVPESHSEHTTHLAVTNGRSRFRPIPVNRANILLFAGWANTADGRWMHYRLTEDIVLEPPAPGQSNLGSVGARTAFAGSFDGNGFTLSGLTGAQGLFAQTTQEALIENLGLEDVAIHHAPAWGAFGGLVGSNFGTVQNCYVTGNMVAVQSGAVGGVVGTNFGTVQNCYATVSVAGNNHVGGVVGSNQGTVQNAMALNAKVIAANAAIGRVVGSNGVNATLFDNAAFTDISGHAWTNIGPDNLDGTSKAAEALQEAEGFPEALRSSPWTYESGKLPGFRGRAVEMPPHLR